MEIITIIACCIGIYLAYLLNKSESELESYKAWYIEVQNRCNALLKELSDCDEILDMKNHTIDLQNKALSINDETMDKNNNVIDMLISKVGNLSDTVPEVTFEDMINVKNEMIDIKDSIIDNQNQTLESLQDVIKTQSLIIAAQEDELTALRERISILESDKKE